MILRAIISCLFLFINIDEVTGQKKNFLAPRISIDSGLEDNFAYSIAILLNTPSDHSRISFSLEMAYLIQPIFRRCVSFDFNNNTGIDRVRYVFVQDSDPCDYLAKHNIFNVVIRPGIKYNLTKRFAVIIANETNILRTSKVKFKPVNEMMNQQSVSNSKFFSNFLGLYINPHYQFQITKRSEIITGFYSSIKFDSNASTNFGVNIGLIF